MQSRSEGLRFLKSTRGRIIMLLRRAARTVDDLAQALDLTNNAVRSHLVVLERDGLVRQAGVRRGVSKPAYAYELAPAAAQLFPQSYGMLLHELLDVLTGYLPPAALDQALQETGRRLAATVAAPGGPSGSLRQRAEYGALVLNELGGLAEVEEDTGPGSLHIRGYGCPLAEAVPGHPEVCRLAEALLAGVIGARVEEQCDRSGPPRCRFAIVEAGAGA